MKVYWLTNRYNPELEQIPDERAATRQLLIGNLLGRPKATEARTVKELEDMGMIGIYREVTE